MKLLAFMPKPPPFNGATYMVELLCDTDFARRTHLRHQDCGFSAKISDYMRFSFRKAFLFWKYWFQLIHGILAHKPDYVILTPAAVRNPFLKDALYWMTASALGRPVVLWAHGNGLKRLYDNSGSLMRWFIRFSHRRVRYAINVGERLGFNYEGLLPPERVGHLHNGVPDEPVQPRPEREDPSILYLSNMHESKGWKVLFEAAVPLCREFPRLRVDFYGNPHKESREELEALFAAGPFPDRVRYHGPVYGEEKDHALQGCSVFCFPSSYPPEAFPLVNLEAMRFSRPIVSTDQGAIREALHHGKGGMIVPQQDPAALAEALAPLLRDPGKRRQMGLYNRRLFEQEYTVERFSDRWIELFERLAREDGLSGID